MRMVDNPYISPTVGSPGVHPLKTAIRIALIATYPLLAVSALAFLGLLFGSAFLAEFHVENQTDEVISVTPIGTVGMQGNRRPLPIYMWPFPPIWSTQRGGFDIPPGESITIIYDMDDINFSEIVVHKQGREQGQLVVNASPTSNQYRAPAQKQFVIQDLKSLETVPRTVRAASREAAVPTNAPWIILSVIFGPWLAYALLAWLNRSCNFSRAVSAREAGRS